MQNKGRDKKRFFRKVPETGNYRTTTTQHEAYIDEEDALC